MKKFQLNGSFFDYWVCVIPQRLILPTTYRNFYNRPVGFVRQHLPDKRIVAEEVMSPDTGESLTIGLLDSIAIPWILSIDKRLISIIKTEFTADL